MMKKLLSVLFALALMPSLAQAAVTVTATQSGADSGSVMAGKTFTVTASGWSGDCTSAYLDLTSCGVCSVSESQSKSVSGTSVSWTTVTAASKASSQSVSVSVSGTCTPDSGSASFDVKNPPSLSGDVSPTSATVTSGSSFSLSLNIQNTGETTARFGTVSASPTTFTATGCTPSDIPGGQSAAVSCTVAASSSATTGTMTLNIAPSNADSLAKSVSVTVSAAPGGSSPGGSSPGSSPSGGAAPPGQQKKEEKNITGKFAPPGLVNNTKLLAAIEKVLAKGNMDQNAVDNLVSKANIIMGLSGVSRTISVDGGKSTVKTTVKYNGEKTAKNYVLYEKIPKAFANSSSLITVTAPGAKVEVVQSDPEYAIVFDTVNPNQDLTVTYSVNKAVATSTVDSFATEVYAESLEEPATVCAQVITPAKNPATGECKEFATPCDVPAGWTKVDSCPSAGAQDEQPTGDEPASRSWAYIIIILVIVAAAAFYYLKMRRPVGF